MENIFKLKVESGNLTKLPDLEKLQEKLSEKLNSHHLDGGGAASNTEEVE